MSRSIVFFILLVVVFTLTYFMTQPYLLAMLMGVIFALLSNGFFEFLKRHKVSPKLASLLTTLAILFVLIGPLSAFISRAVQQGVSFAETLAQDETISINAVIKYLRNIPILSHWIPTSESLERQIILSVQNLGKGASTVLLKAATQVPGLVLQCVLSLIGCFFFLLDGNRFLVWLTEKVPLAHDVHARIFETFHSTVISVIWASLAAAGVQAFLMWIGYLILGVPFPFLAAGATFIFAWIPMVGSAPVWIIGVLYLLYKGSIAKMIAMLVLGLFTGVIDNFVRPWVLKGRGEMHPLVSLVSIFGGLQLFGFVGAFLGPVIVSILRVMIEIWPDVERRTKMRF